MANKIRVLSVPYDSGHHLVRMGRGPAHLLGLNLVDKIRQAGHEVSTVEVCHTLAFPPENATAFELHRLIAEAVRQSRADGAFPLILSGNCNYAAIGAVAGLGPDNTGALWFDAHGECETPETTTSAFLDGMGLAMLVGACWTGPTAGVPGFQPIDPQRAVMIGTRDMSDSEREFLPAHKIGLISVEAVRRDPAAALAPELDRLRTLGVRRLYVHIDADVFDPDTVGHANHFSATAGAGLSAANLHECLSEIASRIPIHAAAITAYDPDVDHDGRMARTLIELSARLSEAGSI